MKTSLNPDIGIVNVLKNTFLSTRGNLVIILLHETYTNLDRLAVQFLLQPRETAPSCPQAFTDKLNDGHHILNQFLLWG